MVTKQVKVSKAFKDKMSADEFGKSLIKKGQGYSEQTIDEKIVITYKSRR